MTSDKPRKRKVGRPRKLTAEKKIAILTVLTIGGSRADAAAIVGAVASTIANEADRDPEFLEGLARAEVSGKIHHLQILFDSGDWRASLAWLARKYPEQWSERQQFSHRHSLDVDAPGISIMTDENWFETLKRFGGN